MEIGLEIGQTREHRSREEAKALVKRQRSLLQIIPACPPFQKIN